MYSYKVAIQNTITEHMLNLILLQHCLGLTLFENWKEFRIHIQVPAIRHIEIVLHSKF